MSNASRYPRANRCGDVLLFHHHAERVRTHRAPRRGL